MTGKTVPSTRSQTSPERVFIYCRVSSAGQEENASLATQVSACERYADEQGWVVVDQESEVHSGADLHGRPGLRRVREALRSGRVDVLLSYAVDRLSRKQAHLAILADECEQAGAGLAFVTEQFEYSAVGEFIRAAKAFAAEIEREKIIERTQRGKRARAESGRPIPGQKAPYGYCWDDPVGKTRLAENPIEADVVRRIFQETASGKSLRRVASGLTEDGIPSPTGRDHWARTTLHAIMNSPTYAGEMRAYRVKRTREKNGRIRDQIRPEADQIPMPHGVAPALVDPALRATALDRLDRNKAESPRRNTSPEATLLRAGFARCGVCGNALIALRRKGNWNYVCTNRDKGFEHRRPSIAANLLDMVIWKKIEHVVTRPEIIAAEVERRRAADPYKDELAAVEKRASSIAARRTRLARAVASLDDDEASAPLLAELRGLAEQAKVLDIERQRVEAAASDWGADRDLLEGLAVWSTRVRNNLLHLSYGERRSLLVALGTEVRVLPSPASPRWELMLRWGDLTDATVSTTR